MEMNKYNDAIRKKLLSIEPEYEQKDWTELKGMLGHSSTLTLTPNSLYKNLLIATLGTLLTLSLFWNYKLQNANHHTQFTKKPKQKTQTQVVYQTDTVFIEKIKYVYPNLGQIERHEALAINSNIENGASSYINEINGVNIGNKRSNTNTTKPKTQGIPYSQKQNLLGAELAYTTSIFNQKNQTVEINADSSQTEELNFDFLEGKQFATTFSKNGLYPKIPSKKSVHSKPPTPYQFSLQMPHIDLKNLKYRFGIEGDLGTEEAAAGLIGEVILNPKLSVSTGVRMAFSPGRDYLTADQYQEETKKDFRSIYAPNLGENQQILNINFRNYILQLPIGLNYKYPLKNQYKILLGIGTILDLKLWQQVKYDYGKDNSHFEEGHSSFSVYNKLINSLQITTGLEKKYGKLVYQLMPYATFYKSQIPYRREEFMAGIKLRVLR
jgi:hypothetical protein